MRISKKTLRSVEGVGGLSISENAVRYVHAESAMRASVGLLPGTVVNGEIADMAQFVEALRALHRQIAPANAVVSVITALPPHHIISESYSIPPSEDAHAVEESANYNLRMLAPFDLGTAYYDAERIGEFDFLAAFIRSSVADAFFLSLRQAGFAPVAVEFPALSLARLLPAKGAYGLVSLLSDGLHVTAVRNQAVYLSAFVPWKEIGAGDAFSFNEMLGAMHRELKKILAFATRRFGGTFAEIAVHAPDDIAPRIAADIIKEFSVPASPLTPRVTTTYSYHWHVAAGAALRGAMPRAKDRAISLAPRGTESAYFARRTRSFFAAWRTAAMLSLGLILLAFLITDNLLLKEEVSVRAQLARGLDRPDVEELLMLQQRAREFNRLIALAQAADAERVDWGAFLDGLADIAGSGISLDGVLVRAGERAGRIRGRAPSEVRAVEFKDRLLADSRFADVVLPLSNIAPDTEGSGVIFQLEFILKSFE